MAVEFELHYNIDNCGDGSASVKFHQTQEDAKKADEKEEGWGEPCYSSVTLRMEDGQLFVRCLEWKEPGIPGYVWKPLQPRPTA